MAKVNVKVLKAVVDGKGEGSTLSIDERSAKHLESIGYVSIEAEEKPTKQPKREASADEKGTSAPKKSASRKRKKQTEEN